MTKHNRSASPDPALLDGDCADPELPTQGQVIAALTRPVKSAAMLVDTPLTVDVSDVLQGVFEKHGDKLQDLVFETARLLAEIQARTGWDDLEIIRAVGCREEITEHTSKDVDAEKLELLNVHLGALLLVAEDAFDSCGDQVIVGRALATPPVRRAVKALDVEAACDLLRLVPELLLDQPLN